MALKTRKARTVQARIVTTATKAARGSKVVERVVTRALAPTMRITKSAEDYTELRRRAEAPTRVDTHAPSTANERIGQASKATSKDRSTRLKDELAADLVDGRKTPQQLGRDVLESFNADTLKAYLKAHDMPGYSTLKKEGLVEYVYTGVRPEKGEPKPESKEALMARAKVYKAAGLISGPVSSASKDSLAEAVLAASQGVKADVKKPAPKEKTADWYKDLLRKAEGGYTATATAKSKELFKVSVSSLKKPQLVELCQALGLS